MKSQTLLLGLLSVLLTAPTAISSGVTPSEFQAQLASIDETFSSQGATFEVLGLYDSLLRQTQDGSHSATLLAKAHYKRAIIALSLGKELQAMDDMQQSLQLDPANSSAKSTLLKMIIQNGDKTRFAKLCSVLPESDPMLKDAKDQLSKIQELGESNDAEKVSEAIQLAPFDPSLRQKRISLTEQSIKEKTIPNEQQSLFADLVDDMSTMIKSNPAKNSQNWNKLSEIYLFGLGEYTTALNANKKCLHYDMDYEPCKKNSKLLNKYSAILTQLTSNSRYLNYLKDEVKDDDMKELDEMDFKDLSTRLTSTDKFLKIRRENENFKTNLEFLQHKSSSFNSLYSLKTNPFEQVIYESLAMDALLRHDAKAFKLYSSHITDTTCLPMRLDSIDRALNRKEFQKAQQEINESAKNMRECHFLQSRAERIQKHTQQQQHQHRQRQQQHFGRQQAPKAPKNDYYKILGVARDADERTIKKAYRELTKQFHPDKYKGDMSSDEVEHKMTQINHAYEVLSDAQMRKDYDLGHDPNDPESQQAGHGHAGGGQPFGNMQFKHSGGAGGNPFGGAGGFNFRNFQFGGMKARGQRKTQKRSG